MQWVKQVRGLIVYVVTSIIVYSIVLVTDSLDSQQVVWIALIIFAFGLGMFALLILEKSVWKNGLFAFLFWVPMAYIHHKGIIAESSTEVDMLAGVVDIGFIGLFHSGIQVWLRGFINRSMVKRLEREILAQVK